MSEGGVGVGVGWHPAQGVGGIGVGVGVGVGAGASLQQKVRPPGRSRPAHPLYLSDSQVVPANSVASHLVGSPAGGQAIPL